MSAEALDDLDDLARARAAFDAWRGGRSGAGRIPEHLWMLAESMLDHHSPQTVARELSLNPARLRARLDRRSASAPKARSSKPTFVELPATAPASVPPPGPVEPVDLVRLTLVRPDGTSLTLAVPVTDPALAEQLIASFTAAVV